MKKVASTDEYTIYQRRDGRYAVQTADRSPVNGEDKVKILLAHELISAPAPKASEPEAAVEEAPAAEASAEPVGEDSADAAEEESAE